MDYLESKRIRSKKNQERISKLMVDYPELKRCAEIMPACTAIILNSSETDEENDIWFIILESVLKNKSEFMEEFLKCQHLK